MRIGQSFSLGGVKDGLFLGRAQLVGLALGQVDDESLLGKAQVLHIESRELGAAESPGEAQQHDPVPQPGQRPGIRWL